MQVNWGKTMGYKDHQLFAFLAELDLVDSHGSSLKRSPEKAFFQHVPTF
jgi:hypothetical protein